jgi:hypothetical protein
MHHDAYHDEWMEFRSQKFVEKPVPRTFSIIQMSSFTVTKRQTLIHCPPTYRGWDPHWDLLIAIHPLFAWECGSCAIDDSLLASWWCWDCAQLPMRWSTLTSHCRRVWCSPFRHQPEELVLVHSGCCRPWLPRSCKSRPRSFAWISTFVHAMK